MQDGDCRQKRKGKNMEQCCICRKETKTERYTNDQQAKMDLCPKCVRIFQANKMVIRPAVDPVILPVCLRVCSLLALVLVLVGTAVAQDSIERLNMDIATAKVMRAEAAKEAAREKQHKAERAAAETDLEREAVEEKYAERLPDLPKSVAERKAMLAKMTPDYRKKVLAADAAKKKRQQQLAKMSESDRRVAVAADEKRAAEKEAALAAVEKRVGARADQD